MILVFTFINRDSDMKNQCYTDMMKYFVHIVWKVTHVCATNAYRYKEMYFFLCNYKYVKVYALMSIY